jgi:hypothetical protein
MVEGVQRADASTFEKALGSVAGRRVTFDDLTGKASAHNSLEQPISIC